MDYKNNGTMKTKKIAVLEKAIAMLEGGFDYRWCDVRRCNCGVVVQACGITDVTEIYNATWTSFWGAGWKRIITTNIKEELRCPITGLQIGLVQQTLVDAGFTGDEIVDLENLSNPEIIKIAGKQTFDNKESLIRYLRAWVGILKEQEPKQPEIKERIVYVSVPVTITNQSKQLILS